MSDNCWKCAQVKVGGTPCDMHAAALPPVRSETMLANQMIVRETIHRLLHELQDRYPATAELPREEVFAWLDSRTTHWFANAESEVSE